MFKEILLFETKNFLWPDITPKKLIFALQIMKEKISFKNFCDLPV